MSNRNAKVCITIQTSTYTVSTIRCANPFPPDTKAQLKTGERDCRCSSSAEQGDAEMLGILAMVLIVLWLLGFFAFHVTTGFIHIVLVVGLVLLVFHLLSGRGA